MTVSDVRSRMRARSPVHLINANYPCAPLAVKLAGFGFDCVFMDCEHGSWTAEQVAMVSTAVTAVGGVPIVRPEANVDWMITRYVNLGARGICLPGLDTAADAHRLVETVKDTEAGRSGGVLVLGILESMSALDDLDAILAVDGIDALMLGPVDLARSLGLRLPDDRPKVDALVHKTLAKLRGLGRACGTRTTAVTRDRLATAGASVFFSHVDDLLEAGKPFILKA